MDKQWESLGIQDDTELIWLADTALVYVKHLLLRLEKENTLTISEDEIKRDLEKIWKRRATLQAREAGVGA